MKNVNNSINNFVTDEEWEEIISPKNWNDIVAEQDYEEWEKANAEADAKECEEFPGDDDEEWILYQNLGIWIGE